MAEHLTHGWEPDTPADDSLVRTFLEGTAARGEYFAALVGGRAARVNGVALADVNSPVWFENTAVLMAPCELLDRDATIATILDFYPRERHIVLFSAFATWDLSDAGFELMGHPPFMVRPAGGGPPPWPTAFEARPVETAEDAATFTRILEDAYPMPGARAAAMAQLSEYDGPMRLYNGYLGGEAVATAGAWVGDGLNDVGWISAMPSTRRKGVGAAITYASTVAEPEMPAVLISSDLGNRVYEALGYLTLFRMTLWHRPPTA